MNTLALFLLTYFCSLTALYSQELHLFPDIIIKGESDAPAIARTWDGNYLISPWIDHVNGVSCGNLVKIDDTGKLVSSFNRITVDNRILKIDTTTGGKILVGGWFRHINGIEASLVRLNADGTLDDTFQKFKLPGLFDEVKSFALQSDGKIVVAGVFSGSGLNSVIRLYPDGSIDASFQSNSWPVGFISNVIVDRFDNIYASDSYSLFKLNKNGVPQSGFPLTVGPSEFFFTLEPYGDKIVIGGRFTSIGGTDKKNIAIINGDGTVDPLTISGAADDIQHIRTTNNGGFVVTTLNSTFMYNSNGAKINQKTDNKPAGIFIDDQQRLLILSKVTFATEFPSDPRLTRYNADYTVDRSFSCIPTRTLGISAISSQPDGRILIGLSREASGINSSNMNLERINLDGTVDNTFELVLPQYQPVNSIATQPDGKILLATNSLSRFHTSGSMDHTFKKVEVNPGSTSLLRKVKIRNEKIYLGGSFKQAANHTSPGIVRINSDGNIDNTFTSALPEDSYVTDFSFQANNKIIVSGFFNFNGDIKAVIRLNENGTIDEAFTKGYHGYNGIWHIAVDSLDNIYLGGGFVDYNGTTIDRLVRLSPNGTPDLTFTPTLPFDINTTIEGLELLSDHEILLGAPYASNNSRSLILLDENGNTIERPFAQLGNYSSISASYFNGETLYLAGRLVSQDQNAISGFGFAALKSVEGEIVDLQAERKKGALAHLEWTNTITQGTLQIIERSENDNTSYTPIDTVSISTLSYDDNGLVANNGYYYRIRAINTNSSTEYSNEAFIDPAPVTSAEMDHLNAVHVYPNPGRDWFTLSLPSVFNGGACSVLSSDGILKDQLSVVLSDGKMILNLTNYSNGLYIIRIEKGTQRAYLKVVKL